MTIYMIYILTMAIYLYIVIIIVVNIVGLAFI